MNKCTLLIDGNWLLMSRFAVMTNLFDSKFSKERLELAKEDLKNMMARSINITLNKLPVVDNIIFISDGGSWRKQLPIPKQLKDSTYKGNRGKESVVAWDYVFKALNELSKSCSKAGITISTQMNIEGDDWVWYWSRRLNEEGVNCIIWSSDHDLMQLIQNKSGVFTAWYYECSGKHARTELIFHNSLEEKIPDSNDLDFFMRPVPYKSRLMEMLEKKVGKAKFIDPNTIINEKIICGDSGDNIRSIVKVDIKGRKYGVGQTTWNKIANKLGIYTIYDLINNKELIADEISNIKKFKGLVNKNDILEMIEYNIKLVWLNEDVIPETVISIMNTSSYDVVDVDYFRRSYAALLDNDDEIRDIFENF